MYGCVWVVRFSVRVCFIFLPIPRLSAFPSISAVSMAVSGSFTLLFTSVMCLCRFLGCWLLCLYQLSVPLPELSASLPTIVVFVPMLSSSALLFVSAIFLLVPRLFAYIFLFFYYKFQSKYQPRAFMSSKELINIALCLLSWLLHPLYHRLHPSSLYCPNWY